MSTDKSLENKPTTGIAWVILGQVVAVATAILFLIGAAFLWLKLWGLPITSSHLTRAQVLGAALFASGIGLGIIGATFTLSVQTIHWRMLFTALTLFGISHIIFGFYVRHAIESTAANTEPALLPLIVSVALWIYSVLLALRASKIAAAQKAKASSESDLKE